MNLSYSETQTMLQESLSRFLTDRYSHEERMRIVRSEAGWSSAIWRSFADELGILRIPFSEELGGVGGGAVENMLVMEEFGASLVVEPYLSTVVVGGAFLRAADRSDLIDAVMEGNALIAFAYDEPASRGDWTDIGTSARTEGADYIVSGHKAVVRDASYATHLIVTAKADDADLTAFLIDADADGIVRKDYRTVDGGVASEIVFDRVRVPSAARLTRDGQGASLIGQVIDEATAALCGEAVGLMRSIQAQTVGYALERKQFGQPIAQYQALQHRMVDMFVTYEQARSLSLIATLKLAKSPLERAAFVSAAKVKVGKAIRFMSQAAIQIHGGMGIADELAIGHFFKRASVLERQFGSIDYHLRRYEQVALLDSLRLKAFAKSGQGTTK